MAYRQLRGGGWAAAWTADFPGVQTRLPGRPSGEPSGPPLAVVANQEAGRRRAVAWAEPVGFESTQVATGIRNGPHHALAAVGAWCDRFGLPVRALTVRS